MRPKSMPPPERFPHGVRARYTSGCRCEDCRKANREYHRQRVKFSIFHGTNELVSANRAKVHLLYLSRNGVGRRAVAAACDVPVSSIAAIRAGEKKHVRRETERRILAVTTDAHLDRALIPAKQTIMQINELLSEGFTKTELARRFGYKSRGLQIKPGKITAKTAAKVDRFYRMIMAEAA